MAWPHPENLKFYGVIHCYPILHYHHVLPPWSPFTPWQHSAKPCPCCEWLINNYLQVISNSNGLAWKSRGNLKLILNNIKPKRMVDYITPKWWTKWMISGCPRLQLSLDIPRLFLRNGSKEAGVAPPATTRPSWHVVHHVSYVTKPVLVYHCITINIDTGKGVQVTDFKTKGLTSDQVHGHLREFHGHGWWNHVKWWASPLQGTVGPGQKVQSFANSHQFSRVSGWTIETGFAHSIRSPHLSETFRENCQNIPLAVSWKLHLLGGSTAPQWRILMALA